MTLVETADFACRHLEQARKEALSFFLIRKRRLQELSARIETATTQGRALDLTDDELRLLMNPTSGDVIPTA